MTLPGSAGGFEFATAGRILFGAGASHQAGKVARELGSHALVVTGSNSKRSAAIFDLLREAGIQITMFEISGEPDVATVDRGVECARAAETDIVISVGGGSAIDAGKAISAMVANPGELLDYLEIIGHGNPLLACPLPFIAMPTTAGTGSEVTRNAVISSPRHGVKVSLRSPFMLPRAAIVDPDLTMGLPAEITAATGLDALTQLIEPYVCTRANPMTDALCVDGIQRAARSLRQAAKEPNAEVRADMSAASLFGGLALANAGLGAVHGFAGPIGGAFSAPHGAVCAALLPHVMEANIAALRSRCSGHPILKRFEIVAAYLTGNPGASADDGVEWVRNLVIDLGIPRLSAHGIREEHVSDLACKALASSSMKPNPVALNSGELEAILRHAL